MNDWNVGATKSSLDTSTALEQMKDGRNRKDLLGGTLYDRGANLGGYGEKTKTEHNGWGSVIDGSPWGRMFGTDYSKQWGETYTTGYDIVGIKGSMVESMRESIREYVARVQNTMTTALEPTYTEAKKAIRGDDAINEVNKYIEKVRTYCENVISSLLVFSDKLADVGNAWNTAQQNMGATISASTGAFSEGTAYSEQVQYTGDTSGGIAGGVSGSVSGVASAVAAGVNRSITK